MAQHGGARHAELRGRVVLVDFWTFTCINWLRTEPYVRAWSRAYRDDGLVVIGVHTPEFSFEHEPDRVRQGEERGHRVPGGARQRLRDLERVRQPLLAGGLLRGQGRRHSRPSLRRGRLRAIRTGHPALARYQARARLRRGGRGEAEADWDSLRSPETYLGHTRGDTPRATRVPPANQRMGARGRVDDRTENVVLDQAGGSIASASTHATRISFCRAGRASRSPSGS